MEWYVLETTINYGIFFFQISFDAPQFQAHNASINLDFYMSWVYHFHQLDWLVVYNIDAFKTKVM